MPLKIQQDGETFFVQPEGSDDRLELDLGGYMSSESVKNDFVPKSHFESEIGRRVTAAKKGLVDPKEFLAGELDITRLMALFQAASMVVGGVGFALPAAIAAGAPCVMIAGGQGAYNDPRVVTSPGMDTSRLRWLMPDAYCRCTDRLHDCPKEITDFRERFLSAVADLEDVRAAA